MSLIKNN